MLLLMLIMVICLYKKLPSATLETLVRALKDIYAKVDRKYLDTEVKVIGTRHGEKLYETLVTREEMVRAIDMGGLLPYTL